MKVCKFGGTSMATAETLRQVKAIIESDVERKFVVVSAPGKRYKEDEKVTDLLYKAFDERVTEGNCASTLAKIKPRFKSLCSELGLKLDIEKYLSEVEEGIDSSTDAAYAASRGEYLAGLIMADFLGFRFVDAAELIKFTQDGRFDAETTNEIIKEYAGYDKGIVIPGFYGERPDGTIQTFSRGGSDFTGAIIAKGIEAVLYENWTDVNGFMAADPRIVDNPHFIVDISYEELRELSYMGASVLHPDSVFPVQEAKIPINIKNTFSPEHKGTMILHKVVNEEGKNLITGIAGRKGNFEILMKKSMMNNELGFARKVLSVLEKYGISVEHIPTGIDTMSVILSENGFKAVSQEQILSDIKEAVNPDCISIQNNIALIAVVGRGMANKMGTAARVFTALSKANVNIKLIDQGSSELNIIVGVEDDDYNKSIAAIYKEFFA